MSIPEILLTNWLEAIPATYRRVQRPEPPALADCGPIAPEEAAAMLSDNGLLARRIPGYELRPGQVMMVRAVAEALNLGQHLVVEAGTGIGKTLGYLLPLALWSRLNDTPVVISTNTRNLQTQLIEKDLPLVQRLLDELPRSEFPQSGAERSLQVALIKGRSNYLCLRKLEHLIEDGRVGSQPSELQQLAAIVAWAQNSPTGDLETMAADINVEPAIGVQLSSSGEECPGQACRHFRRCFVQKEREKALRADIIVANHHLVLSELDSSSPVTLPRHRQIVFDEAHNLEEAATSHFTVEVSPLRVHILARRLHHGQGRIRRGALARLRRSLFSGALRWDDEFNADISAKINNLVAGVSLVRRESNRFFHKLHALLPIGKPPLRYSFPDDPEINQPINPPNAAKWEEARSSGAILSGILLDFIDQLISLHDDIHQETQNELNLMAEELSDLDGAIQAFTSLRDDLEYVLAGSDQDSVFWIQQRINSDSMGEAYAAPIKVGPLLATSLYAIRQSVILCSATMSVSGRFQFIGDRLGLNLIEEDRISSCIAPSPFDFPTQCALLAPTYLCQPTALDRSYSTELAALIGEVANRLGGNTLVLFTSYEMLGECDTLVRSYLESMDIKLLVQGEGTSRDALLNAFRGPGRHVLFGTHSFWEGIDVVGQALSCVIIARLPFTSPGDPIFSARCERMEQEGLNSFRGLSLPTAILRLRQGFGRLIRHRNDRGVVIIADTRILTKSYGKTFGKNLPLPVTPSHSSAELLLSVQTAVSGE